MAGFALAKHEFPGNRWLLALFYGVAGYFHISNPDPFLRIMPGWVPQAEAEPTWGRSPRRAPRSATPPSTSSAARCRCPKEISPHC